MELLVSIIVGVATGITSSLIATKITWNRQEKRLVNQFRYLEGIFDHILPDQTRKEGATTTITYTNDGILLVKSETKYGDWDGQINMNVLQPEYGEGTFNYKNRNESGRMKIMVRDRDTVFVFPETLTHKNQKTDFYIFRRRVAETSNQIVGEIASLALPNPQ